MADSLVQVPPDSTGKKIASTSVVVGAHTVERQEVVICGPAATDRAPVTLVDGLLVHLGTNNEVSVDSVLPGVGALNLGKAEDAVHNSGDVGVMALAVQKTTGAALAADGDYVPLQTNASGALRVQIDADIVANGGSQTGANSVSVVRASDDPVTPVQFLDIDETEEEIKATAGTLYSYHLHNLSAGTRYVKFYDAPASGVTVGSTTPKFTIPLTAGMAVNISLDRGWAFASGICVACTTGFAVSDTGAPGTNDCVGNFGFK